MGSRSEIIKVPRLGEPKVTSPLLRTHPSPEEAEDWCSDETYVRLNVQVNADGAEHNDPLLEKAGARARIYFDPQDTRVAIVTCGGLCPGLNNVIRSAFVELHYNYGVRDVLGVRYGYRGLNTACSPPPLRLTPELVEQINDRGGTILGTSRGQQDPDIMVDMLERERISMLLCIGGDGTQRGAHAIHETITRRGAKIAVVGIPKTIDNDVHYCQVTFGYNTAIDAARTVLEAAHNEASSAYNGVGLVKVMGRDSGFIAAGATLASQDVNFTLVPEVPFRMDVLCAALAERLKKRGHAVIVVAEGAGQDLFEAQRDEHDASGNVRYNDIGLFLRDRIRAYFAQESIPVDLKYIDPSYIIRSVPANCHDSMLCDQLARRAVHAGMAGRTDVLIGYLNGTFIHVPISMVTAVKKQIDPRGEIWRAVQSSTGQPAALV